MKAWIVVAIAIGVVLAVAAYFYTEHTKSVATSNSIAVLPFVNASGDATKFESELRTAYSRSGEKGMLERLRDLLKTSKRQDYSYAHFLGMTLILLGELDEAFVWLNKSADLKHPGIAALRVDPLFDEVRSDPRFEQLMKRVGL